MKLVSKILISTAVISGLFGVVSMSGCSITKENNEIADKAIKKGESIYDKNQVQVPDSLVTDSDNVFLAASPFKITHTTPLPAVFNKPLIYTTSAGESISDTVSTISNLSGMPIGFKDDTLGKLVSQHKNVSGIVTYQGTLRNVINQLADRFGLYWKYEDGKVEMFAVETKVYELDAPIGSFDIANSVSSTSETSSDSSGSSSSSSGGSTSIGGNAAMNLSYKMTADSPWKAAAKTIGTMLSAKGKMTDNPVEGYVTVTDNPHVQKQVADYVQKINNKTNQKIAVKIDVYDVETNSTSDFGMDLDAFVGVLSDEATIQTSASSLLNTDLTSNLSTVTFQTDGDSSHNVVLKALNTVGKATEVTGATIYTISGQPAPIQSIQQVGYLESVSTTTFTDGGGTATSLVPGTIVTGYSMTVTPKIESNKQVMVNLNLQLSTLVSLTKIGAQDSDSSDQIQVPKIHTKNFLENMILHSGQSLLIAGFKDDSADTLTGSPTSTDMWVGGGSKSTQKVQTTTVIVVTPYIIGD